jgi:hypothetical protein
MVVSGMHLFHRSRTHSLVNVRHAAFGCDCGGCGSDGRDRGETSHRGRYSRTRGGMGTLLTGCGGCIGGIGGGSRGGNGGGGGRGFGRGPGGWRRQLRVLNYDAARGCSWFSSVGSSSIAGEFCGG